MKGRTMFVPRPAGVGGSEAESQLVNGPVPLAGLVREASVHQRATARRTPWRGAEHSSERVLVESAVDGSQSQPSLGREAVESNERHEPRGNSEEERAVVFTISSSSSRSSSSSARRASSKEEELRHNHVATIRAPPRRHEHVVETDEEEEEKEGDNDDREEVRNNSPEVVNEMEKREEEEEEDAEEACNRAAVASVLSKLDVDQRACAQYAINQPLIIEAGAGSGKTTTVATRIAFLVMSGVPPRRILGVCFTRLAAETLRLRVQRVLPDHLKSAALQLKLKTLHAFGLECLRLFSNVIKKYPMERRQEIAPGSAPGQHMKLCFLAPTIQVISPQEQYKIAREIVKEHGEVCTEKRAVKSLVEYINMAKCRKKEPIVQLDRLDQDAYLFRFYQEELHNTHSSVDFGDLQQLFFQLLQLPAPRKDESTRSQSCWLSSDSPINILRRLYTHIIVDEFQDLNEVQFEIMALLAGDTCRVTCIGDPNQCIYGWRGAMPAVFVKWATRFRHTQLSTLTMNYRSSAEIVEAANSIVNAHQESFSGPSGVIPCLVTCNSIWQQFHRVLPRVVEDIRNRNPSLRFGDIAVLCRTRVSVRTALKGLRAAGIPAVEIRGRQLDTVSLVKSFLAFVRLCVNPHTNADVECVLKSSPCLLKGRGVHRFFFTLQAISRERREVAWHYGPQSLSEDCSFFTILREYVSGGFAHIHGKLDATSQQRECLTRFTETVAGAREKLLRRWKDRNSLSTANLKLRLRSAVTDIADRGGFLSTDIRLHRYESPTGSTAYLSCTRNPRVADGGENSEMDSDLDGLDDAEEGIGGKPILQLLLDACDAVVDDSKETAEGILASGGFFHDDAPAHAAALLEEPNDTLLDPLIMLQRALDEFTTQLPCDDFGSLCPMGRAQEERVCEPKEEESDEAQANDLKSESDEDDDTSALQASTRMAATAQQSRRTRVFSDITSRFCANLNRTTADDTTRTSRSSGDSEGGGDLGVSPPSTGGKTKHTKRRRPSSADPRTKRSRSRTASTSAPRATAGAAVESVNVHVAVTTVHQAKGMEWPAVIIPGCYKGEFPIRENDIEERRVFFVAMSRAMRELVFLTAKHFELDEDEEMAPMANSLGAAIVQLIRRDSNIRVANWRRDERSTPFILPDGMHVVPEPLEESLSPTPFLNLIPPHLLERFNATSTGDLIPA